MVLMRNRHVLGGAFLVSTSLPEPFILYYQPSHKVTYTAFCTVSNHQTCSQYWDVISLCWINLTCLFSTLFQLQMLIIKEDHEWRADKDLKRDDRGLFCDKILKFVYRNRREQGKPSALKFNFLRYHHTSLLCSVTTLVFMFLALSTSRI
jgi:hypothetical protein